MSQVGLRSVRGLVSRNALLFTDGRSFPASLVFGDLGFLMCWIRLHELVVNGSRVRKAYLGS
jgi:hypothetical protein